MSKLSWLAALAVMCAPCNAVAKDPVEALATTLGADGLKSIHYEATGTAHSLGASVRPGDPWPGYPLGKYSRSIDYEAVAGLEDMLRVGHLRPKETQGLRGEQAWTQWDGGGPPAPASPLERRLQLWLTPHGWVKAARQSRASLGTRAGERGATVVSFTIENHVVSGTIDAAGLLESATTTVAHPFFGDMEIENRFADYQDYGGIKFPGTIVQRQAGHPMLDLKITAVLPNAPLNLEVPEIARKAPTGPPPVRTEKLADGVWLVSGGSHSSAVIELTDSVAVFEAPVDEARSVAVMETVKSLVPGKPIRYLLITHHHQDHAAGVRTYVAEGVTLVAHESARSYFDPLFAAIHRIKPDRLSKEMRAPRYELVSEKPVIIRSGAREIQVHHVRNDPHAASMTLVWLPQEKLLFEGDVYNPFPGSPQPPGDPVLKNFYDNVQRLKLDVATVVPVHGVPTKGADFAAAANAAR